MRSIFILENKSNGMERWQNESAGQLRRVTSAGHNKMKGREIKDAGKHTEEKIKVHDKSQSQASYPCLR